MASVDLSRLNRAALAAKEGYGWIHILALTYCVVIGAFSVGAWLNDEQPFRAAVCAGAQTLSVIMALLGRRAFTGQMFWEGVACVAIAFGFSTWAAAGLEHAWSANGAAIEQWQVWFLTGTEPAIFLLIEHIKEGRETLRAAQEQADRETAEALATARAKDEAHRPKSPVNRAAGEKATVTRLKLVETARQPDDQPVEVAEPPAQSTADRLLVDLSGDQPADRPGEPEHSARTFADADAHARHLIAADGVRHRNELVRRVRGLTAYKATRLLDELAPDWRTKTAAA